jgi:hypothetical protein
MRRGGYVNICRGLQCHTPVEEAETAAKRSGREQFGVKRWARCPHKEEPTRGVSFLPKLRTVSFRWYALGARFQELHPGLVAMGHQMRSVTEKRRPSVDDDGIANTPPSAVRNSDKTPHSSALCRKLAASNNSIGASKIRSFSELMNEISLLLHSSKINTRRF